MERVAKDANFRRQSLQALSCLILGHSISKRQQCSNWAAAQLTAGQVRYAATDAWVSREVTLALAPLWFPHGSASVDKRWLAQPQKPRVDVAAVPPARAAAAPQGGNHKRQRGKVATGVQQG